MRERLGIKNWNPSHRHSVTSGCGKNPKPRWRGSVAGVSSEMTLEEVTDGVGLLIVFANANARWERGRRPKYEIEPLGLDFGHAVGNGGGN